MYDLEKDPDELHNIVTLNEYNKSRKKLLGILNNHIQDKLNKEKLQKFVSGAAAGSAMARR